MIFLCQNNILIILSIHWASDPAIEAYPHGSPYNQCSRNKTNSIKSRKNENTKKTPPKKTPQKVSQRVFNEAYDLCFPQPGNVTSGSRSSCAKPPSVRALKRVFSCRTVECVEPVLVVKSKSLFYCSYFQGCIFGSSFMIQIYPFPPFSRFPISKILKFVVFLYSVGFNTVFERGDWGSRGGGLGEKEPGAAGGLEWTHLVIFYCEANKSNKNWP